MALKRETWDEVRARKLAGYFIFLDIDGTPLPDAGEAVREHIRLVVRAFAASNHAVLLSNSRRAERARAISEQIGLPLIKTHYRKPSARVLRDIPEAQEPLLVIGDKITTDALFARAINAKCILVERERSRTDRRWVDASYVFDDVVGFILDTLSLFANIAP